MIMSFSNNKTGELWRSFMPVRKEIQNITGTEFEKWAAIEVTGFDTVPDGMEPFTLPGGLYAVFLYKGAASAATTAFQYILGTWLPTSGYSLDNRTHFEILGEKYKNEDPDSEEEIRIPIKPNL